MDTKKSLTPILLGAILFGVIATFFAILYAHNASEQSGVLAGSSDVVVFNYFGNDNGTFTGSSEFSFTPGYTRAIETRYTTEHALYVNCSKVNVTGLFYEISADNNQWYRGAVAMTPCLNNGSKYDLTDKAFNYIRINVSANNGTAGQLPNSTSRLLLGIMGK